MMQCRRSLARALMFGAALVCAGCASMSESPLTSWISSIPHPSFAWLTGGSKKPGPLPALNATITPRINWQQPVGKAGPGISPAVTTNAVYAASSDGTLMRLETATGRVVWRASAGKPLSAGPGASDDLVVVGTEKGEVLAFDADGKPLWTARVTSELIAPPRISDKVVIVFSGDGRIYGLGSVDGKTLWV
ncbi:MAG TPA: PQQ-binding-like beta-propeller repeat protein, partial [Casimicrobiaceae bacterium]|nr:PQQ-binding-like beta-propeller repeat protein [Casimicrobiaceae bacterium]